MRRRLACIKHRPTLLAWLLLSAAPQAQAQAQAEAQAQTQAWGLAGPHAVLLHGRDGPPLRLGTVTFSPITDGNTDGNTDGRSRPARRPALAPRAA